MRFPKIEGLIRRRVLVNFRVDPAVIRALLPAPLRPQITGGAVQAGICLIRLETMRVAGLPAALGFDSENAAHRIAVEWDAAARARMKEIPAFVRGMVSRRVETYCRDQGIARITPEILAEIRAKMPTPKLFGGRS